ncbi:MAG: L,D-transpeptidase [Crocinitomicaceae bacterium]
MKHTLKNWLKLSSVSLLLGVVAFVVFRNFPAKAEQTSQKEEVIEIEEEHQVPVIIEPTINYSLVAAKDTSDWLSSLEKGGDTLNALMVVNRCDPWRLKHLDTIILPDSVAPSIDLYVPFPKQMDALKEVKKIMLVSHYAQAYIVYENGELVKWGPVNLGTKYKPTPTGLFAVNWKAKRTTSTINSSWILDWYCNIDNFEGIGMHQYALPGYPASHGCVRLYRDDSNWLYHWADQWSIKEGKVDVYGTPVVIFGEYPYGEQKPWIAHSKEENGLKISEEELNKIAEEYLPTIMERQTKRDSVEMSKLVADQIQ